MNTAKVKARMSNGDTCRTNPVYFQNHSEAIVSVVSICILTDIKEEYVTLLLILFRLNYNGQAAAFRAGESYWFHVSY
jgi:hypothetical protein